jgi:hypothetical protein
MHKFVSRRKKIIALTLGAQKQKSIFYETVCAMLFRQFLYTEGDQYGRRDLAKCSF